MPQASGQLLQPLLHFLLSRRRRRDRDAESRLVQQPTQLVAGRLQILLSFVESRCRDVEHAVPAMLAVPSGGQSKGSARRIRSQSRGDIAALA